MTDTWELPDDALKKGLQYPNYNIIQSPSGHRIIMDDSEGAESLTYEHRSGSKIQFQPDGSVVFINKKDAYHVTFGDNNMMVTGAHNITVNGGGSLKVEGDYDMTVNGHMRTTVKGNHETIVNGDQTTAVKGKKETVVGEDQSVKIGGKSEFLAHKTFFAAETDLGMDAGSDISAKAGKNIGAIAGKNISTDAGDNTNITSGSVVGVKSALLTHNNIDVGDDHKHLDVMPGGGLTGVPVG